MSIDYNKNVYVKIGSYANVVNEIAKSNVQHDGVSQLYGSLDQLVYKLALAHPEWQFVGEDSWYSAISGAYGVKRLRVYEQHDQIGFIRVDTYGSERFEIGNPRISASMARRNYKTTKSVATAINIVEQFFSAKTISERVTAARTSVSSAINNKGWSAKREFNTVMEKLAPALAAYVVANMPEVRPTLEAYGAHPAALDMLVERSETHKLCASFIKARTDAVGTTVMLHGDRYLLLPDDNNLPPVVQAASQLSDDMRGKLGILKIVGEGEFIESVGTRVDATTFYLLP